MVQLSSARAASQCSHVCDLALSSTAFLLKPLLDTFVLIAVQLCDPATFSRFGEFLMGCEGEDDLVNCGARNATVSAVSVPTGAGIRDCALLPDLVVGGNQSSLLCYLSWLWFGYRCLTRVVTQ